MGRKMGFRIARIFVFAASLGAFASAAEPRGLTWRRITPLPTAIAGHFIGTSHGMLIVAGGTRVSSAAHVKPQLVWEDRVYLLARPSGAWKTGYRLPVAMAYGASISTTSGLLCLGGANHRGHSNRVILLRVSSRGVETQELPSLPWPCAYQGAALVAGAVYSVGGLPTFDPEDPRTHVCCLALPHGDDYGAADASTNELAWQTLPDCPDGARALPLVVSGDGEVLVMSGFRIEYDTTGTALRAYRRDVYRLTTNTRTWHRGRDMPRAAVGAATFVAADGSILVLGGDDGGRAKPDAEGRASWYSTSVLRYEPALDRWSELDAASQMPSGVVTSAAAAWQDGLVIAGGEQVPAARSAEVHHAAFRPN